MIEKCPTKTNDQTLRNKEKGVIHSLQDMVPVNEREEPHVPITAIGKSKFRDLWRQVFDYHPFVR